MKKLEILLTLRPSYTKWGNARLSEKTGLAESTVARFKKSERFKQIKSNYLKSLN